MTQKLSPQSSYSPSVQVWLGPKVAPAIESSAWQDVVNRPRPWQQGGSPGPAQPLTLACRIVSAHSANLVDPQSS